MAKIVRIRDKEKICPGNTRDYLKRYCRETKNPEDTKPTGSKTQNPHACG